MSGTAVYIMGAGRATRMKKHDMPKPLLPLHGNFTLLDYQYELYEHNNVFVITGYKNELYDIEKHDTVYCPDWHKGIIESYKAAFYHAERQGYDRLVLVDGDVLISKKCAEAVSGFDFNSILLVHEVNSLNIGLSGYTISKDDNGYHFDIMSPWHFGCIVNLHKETLRRFIFQKATKPDLFVECLYGETFNTIWESTVYLEVDTDEDYEQVKKIVQNGGYFWLNRNSDIHKEASARLHGGELYKKRLKIEKEYLSFLLTMHTDYGQVLDLGAGTGELLHTISCCQKRTARIIAPDINESFCNKINWMKIPNVVAPCFNILSLQWPGVDHERYDLITMLGFIQYIMDDELLKAVIKKCYGLLNPGGHIIVRNSTSTGVDIPLITKSEDLDAIYSSNYRSAIQVVNLFKDCFSLISVNKLYPKELDSKHGTEQYYFVFQKQ